LWLENIAPAAQFSTDAQTGKLPAMSWMVAPYDVSEHPLNSVCRGELDDEHFECADAGTRFEFHRSVHHMGRLRWVLRPRRASAS
jgi:hypothetical protein